MFYPAATYKACQPFLPLNPTVLFGRFRSSKMFPLYMGAFVW